MSENNDKDTKETGNPEVEDLGLDVVEVNDKDTKETGNPEVEDLGSDEEEVNDKDTKETGNPEVEDLGSDEEVNDKDTKETGNPEVEDLGSDEEVNDKDTKETGNPEVEDLGLDVEEVNDKDTKETGNPEVEDLGSDEEVNDKDTKETGNPEVEDLGLDVEEVTDKDTKETDNPEVEDLGSDVEDVSENRNSGRSTVENTEETGSKAEAPQENIPDETTPTELVAQAPLNPAVPSYTPSYAIHPPLSINQNENDVSSVPSEVQTETNPPSNLASAIPNASMRQLNLYNSAMGRFRALQYQRVFPPFPQFPPPNSPFLPFPPPAHTYEQPQQYVFPMQPIAHLVIPQPNYGFPPQENIFFSENGTIQLEPQAGSSSGSYQNVYTNLHHLFVNAPCPYGHNVISPFPAYCPYCFPTAVQPIEEFHFEDDSSRTRRRRGGNKKKGSGNGNGRPGRDYPQDGTSKKPEEETTNETGTSEDNLPSEEHSEVQPEVSSEIPAEVSIKVPAQEQIYVEGEYAESTTLSVVDIPQQNENKTPEELESEHITFITTGVSIPGTTSITTVTSASTSSGIVVPTTLSQMTRVHGHSVSCQTDTYDSRDILLVECWTQTDSPSQSIKYASPRSISSEKTQDGKTVSSESTQDSKTKTSNTTNNDASATNIITAETTSIKTTSTNTTNTNIIKGNKSDSHISTVSSSSKVSPSKAKPISYAAMVAKKPCPKKEVIKPKTPVTETRKPTLLSFIKKVSTPPKVGVPPKQVKGTDSLKLRNRTILELSLRQRVDYATLKSYFKRYIFKGMKLHQVNNKLYLLIFSNTADAKEVKRTNYVFGDMKAISEACPKSQKEVEIILGKAFR